eukprot:TRINITY_DN2286_c0_g1_i1.p1 TRINITY_DN2286_c0_g1~~TRINITY_DN2286_c0_g1_i1.p1  ORF type:complete len:120 (-),score=17.16 TRINITY_DN2286_c0_g1_i1:640-999(-)
MSNFPALCKSQLDQDAVLTVNNCIGFVIVSESTTMAATLRAVLMAFFMYVAAADNHSNSTNSSAADDHDDHDDHDGHDHDHDHDHDDHDDDHTSGSVGTVIGSAISITTLLALQQSQTV